MIMATMYYRPYTTEPLKDDELPSHEAIESILPDYQYIFLDPDTQKHLKDKSSTHAPTDAAPGPSQEPPQADASRAPDIHAFPQYLVDHHMKELETYRTAIHKMGQDLLVWREKLRQSELSNSQLRSDLSRYNDTTKLLLDSSEIDGITKPELAGRYTALKQKLSSQSNELKAYKDKVCHLQNEIIKKNDEAKDFISIRNAHQSQQSTLHKLQERNKKMKKLEDTCRKQEKVIEKLELLIEKSKSKKNNGLSTDTNDVLLEENKRLREELQQTKELLSKQTASDPANEATLLELHQALEKANGRIMALERQMDSNARVWGREKADLLLRQKETERGFKPTVGISDPLTGRFLEQYQPATLRENRRNKSSYHKKTKNYSNY